MYEGDGTYSHHHDGPEQDRAAEFHDETTAPAESDTRDDANAGQQGVTLEEHGEEANGNHNEDETAAFHSATTSGSLDDIARPDDYEERGKDVITLKTAGANSGEKTCEFFDPSQDLSEEGDGEYEDADYEEEHQNLEESNQERPEEYQEQDPQQSTEHEESEHAEENRHTAEVSKQDEASEYQDEENLGDVGNACEYFSHQPHINEIKSARIFVFLATVDEGQLLELSDPLDLKYEADYDQGLHEVLHLYPTSG